MEPRGATGGNLSQIARPKNGPDQAKTVATGCSRSPFGAHGKEGVDGSSPSEGSAKVPHTRFLFSDRLADSGTWPRYGALYGAFRSRKPPQKRRFLAEPSLIHLQQARRRFIARARYGPAPDFTSSSPATQSDVRVRTESHRSVRTGRKRLGSAQADVRSARVERRNDGHAEEEWHVADLRRRDGAVSETELIDVEEVAGLRRVREQVALGPIWEPPWKRADGPATISNPFVFGRPR
jgi:hypothetical protein